MILLLAAITASAVKMQPGVFRVSQSDGTTLSVRAFGDEDLSYFLAADGTLLCQEGTDFFIASVAPDGQLAPTRLLAHDPAQRTLAETAAATAQNRSLFYSTVSTQAAVNKVRREPMKDDSTLMPSLGKQKVLVILVEFSDSTFKFSDPKTVFNKYLNARELFSTSTDPEMFRNYGSVARYFNDMSFGLFQPQFDLYGPVKLPNPLKYYGAGYSSSENMKGLLEDACTAVDDEVDFSQYDSNGDGIVDLVYIIYAGYSQSIAGNSTDCIHPKSGTVYPSKTFDGKNIRRYGVNNELYGTPQTQANGLKINGIGLFCHEFSHCMGLPDLYATAGSTAEKLVNQTMDYWSLMDAGEYTYNGFRPTAYTAWERERLGWMTIDTLTVPADVELKPIADGGKAYRILNDSDLTGHEYYIVENVQQSGWNRYLFGKGMMVTHVDYDDYQFTLGGCKVNSTSGHPRMTVLPADGLFVPEYYIDEKITESTNATLKKYNADLYAKYAGQTFTSTLYKTEAAGDLFPGATGATALTDSTAPQAATVYTGSTMHKPITDIAEDSATGTVSFKFMGGKTSGITAIENQPQATSRIYSISGQSMGTDIRRLPKGIYIVGGKKVVKE